MARKNYVPVRLNDEELIMLDKLVEFLSKGSIKEVTKADVIRYALECTYEIDVVGILSSNKKH